MTPSALLELRAEAPRLLAQGLRNGGDFADLFAESGTVSGYVLRKGRGRPVEQHRMQPLEGWGLRVVSGETSRYSWVDGIAPGALADSEAHRSSPVEMKAIVDAAFDAVLSLSHDIAEVEISLQARERDVLVAPSDRPAAVFATSWTALRVETRSRSEGAIRTAYAIGGGPGGLDRFIMEPPELVARECLARLEALLDADTAFRGEIPVVISSGWGGVWLHEALGHLLEADVASTGPFPSRLLGQRVAPECVHIVDGMPLQRTVDDEGIEAERTTLIEGGVLRALMTDRIRAAASGLPLSGNGYRQDYRHEPLPRMSNLFMQAGTDSAERLIEEVPHGLYVRMISNGRVHAAEDCFSFDVAEGYHIERGQLGRAVSGVRVHGRPSNVLHHVVGIADDLAFDHARGNCLKEGQHIAMSVGMPTVLISNLSVEPLTA